MNNRLIPYAVYPGAGILAPEEMRPLSPQLYNVFYDDARPHDGTPVPPGLNGNEIFFLVYQDGTTDVIGGSTTQIASSHRIHTHRVTKIIPPTSMSVLPVSLNNEIQDLATNVYNQTMANVPPAIGQMEYSFHIAARGSISCATPGSTPFAINASVDLSLNGYAENIVAIGPTISPSGVALTDCPYDWICAYPHVGQFSVSVPPTVIGSLYLLPSTPAVSGLTWQGTVRMFCVTRFNQALA